MGWLTLSLKLFGGLNGRPGFAVAFQALAARVGAGLGVASAPESLFAHQARLVFSFHDGQPSRLKANYTLSGKAVRR